MVLEPLLRDVLRDLECRGVPKKASIEDGAQAVQIALLRYLLCVFLHEVLDGLAFGVDAAIVCHCEVTEFLAHLDLFRRDIRLRASPCVELRHIVLLAFHIMEADLPVRIRRTVEQILELHLGELFIS